MNGPATNISRTVEDVCQRDIAMIDEIQPVGPSGLLNLIEAMKRGIPVGPAATGSDDNPSKQALADIQYPAAQGATPNLQAAPFGALAMPAPGAPANTGNNAPMNILPSVARSMAMKMVQPQQHALQARSFNGARMGQAVQ